MLARGGSARMAPPAASHAGDLPAWEELGEENPTGELPPAPATRAEIHSPFSRFPASANPHPPVPTVPTLIGHAPTGWDWFAHWSFPTQLLLFSLVVAAGMWWLEQTTPPPVAVNPPPITTPTVKPRPRLRPDTFDWLNRLRETQVVSDQLEAEFTEAQQFYREYALDEFLDFDPWSLGADEVLTLTHFCDQGFFTVEREILIKILERTVFDRPPGEATTPRGAIARLEAAARDREARLTSLREASELYRRGRSAEITLPAALTPEVDQAQRAALVDKLATVRRERERLDARIAELNALLR